MLSYVLRKRRFSRSFEPTGDGFLYRRTSRSQAIPVTSVERDKFFRDFRREYFKLHLTLWGVFFALILVLIGIFFLLNTGEVVMQISIYLLIFAFVAGTFVIDRRLLDQPQRHLVGRMPVTLERSWKDVRLERISKASWTRLAITGIVFGGIAWLTFPGPGVARWIPIVWASYFALCFGLWGRNLWTKFKMEKNVL